ncbi:MAG: hypothetical protein WAM43_14095, partial [Terriglobales bacterium]
HNQSTEPILPIDIDIVIALRVEVERRLHCQSENALRAMPHCFSASSDSIRLSIHFFRIVREK